MKAPESHVTVWRKSSYSTNNGDCVEVGLRAAVASVRDTKDREGGTLGFGVAQWRAFLVGVTPRH